MTRDSDGLIICSMCALDTQGRPFHVDCRNVLATNGRVHDEMVRLLRTA